MATNVERVNMAEQSDWGLTLENVGANIIRYALVLILLWIGLIKFTVYEAEAIQGLIANSPLMSWMFSVMSVRTASALVGTIEIVSALLIATRPFAPKLSAIGSFGAILVFLITLTFILTTPGVWQAGYGFPFPSMTGAFLMKDLALLGIAVWSVGEALRAARREEVVSNRTAVS